MAKILALVVVLSIVLANVAGDGCPLASEVASCTPTCQTDRDCPKNGSMCCVNACNSKSCVEKLIIQTRNSKLVVIALALALCVVLVSAAGDECPLASKIPSCSPTCQSDRDCATIGGKCCSNSCNRKSCVEKNKLTQGSKYGSSSGSGSYCGSTKCNSFEKCGTDPATKKQKCVRG